jgi:hypothetical protein
MKKPRSRLSAFTRTAPPTDQCEEGSPVRKQGRHVGSLIGLLLISLVVPLLSVIPAQAAPALAIGPATTRPVLFGGSSPLVQVESKVGHLDIVRLYYKLGEKFDGPIVRQVMGRGSSALVSLDDPPAGGPRYSAIIAGRYDKEIRAFYTQVEQAAVKYRIPAVYVTFEHEANAPTHQSLGTPAQFVAAYNHIHALAGRAKLNWNSGGRLHWALVLMHLAYFPSAQRPQWSLPMGFAGAYWPGRDVDVVAADGYNSGTCDQSTNPSFLQPGAAVDSPSSLFDPVLAFAKAHGNLPVFITEWGSIGYKDSKIRPEFIRSMQDYVLSHPTIKAAMYWDSRGGANHGRGTGATPACNYSINHDPQALTALAAMNRALTDDTHIQPLPIRPLPVGPIYSVPPISKTIWTNWHWSN